MNKAFNIAAFLAFIWLFSWHNCALADGKTSTSRIFINEFSRVQGEQILLGKIARIEAIDFVREVLENISFGRSPRPGRIKTFTGKRVAAIIRSGRDLPGDIEVIVPEKIYVKQAHQEIREDDIRRQVAQWLDQYFMDKEYQIKTLRIQAGKRYPAGTLEFRPGSQIKIDGKGHLNFPMEVWVDDRKVDTLRLRGKVAVYEKVVCAAENLEKGNALNLADVTVIKKDIFSCPNSVIRDKESLEGHRLKTNVKKGSPIKAAWLAPLPLIRKGEVVSLVARTNALKIVTSGIAVEDGFRDRPVKVENLTSGKRVRGIARASSTVEVIY